MTRASETRPAVADAPPRPEPLRQTLQMDKKPGLRPTAESARSRPSMPTTIVCMTTRSQRETPVPYVLSKRYKVRASLPTLPPSTSVARMHRSRPPAAPASAVDGGTPEPELPPVHVRLHLFSHGRHAKRQGDRRARVHRLSDAFHRDGIVTPDGLLSARRSSRRLNGTRQKAKNPLGFTTSGGESREIRARRERSAAEGVVTHVNLADKERWRCTPAEIDGRTRVRICRRSGADGGFFAGDSACLALSVMRNCCSWPSRMRWHTF